MLESILYVEDEEITAQMMGEILNSYCENLYFAQNGKIGLEIFSKNKIDLIITDINMPILNGLEMIRKIREENKDIAIICMTSYEKELEENLEMLDIYANVRKPINIKKLITLIETVKP